MIYVDKLPLPPLRAVLQRYDLQAKKGLGQNFILNPQRLAQIAQFPDHLPETTVIEVGAGPGALTRALLEAGALRVIAVEIDARCIPALQDIQACVGRRLIVHQADALLLDLETLDSQICEESPRVIIANLPYHISVPLLIQWLQQASAFQNFFLMFQKEVADRLLAGPGSKTYGRLSVMAQWKCEVKKLLDLPPQDFTPAPKIFSTLLQFKPRSNYIKVSWKAMERVTLAAFGQRRKMLRAGLKSLWAEPEHVLQIAQIDPTRRAETLSIEEFARLAAQL